MVGSFRASSVAPLVAPSNARVMPTSSKRENLVISRPSLDGTMTFVSDPGPKHCDWLAHWPAILGFLRVFAMTFLSYPPEASKRPRKPRKGRRLGRDVCSAGKRSRPTGGPAIGYLGGHPRVRPSAPVLGRNRARVAGSGPALASRQVGAARASRGVGMVRGNAVFVPTGRRQDACRHGPCNAGARGCARVRARVRVCPRERSERGRGRACALFTISEIAGVENFSIARRNQFSFWFSLGICRYTTSSA